MGSELSALASDFALLLDGSMIAAGVSSYSNGEFSRSSPYMWRWNGSAWTVALASGDGSITTIAPLPGGGLAAGGSFTNIGGVAANRIAKWGGTTWAPLGAGVDGTVYSLATLPNGQLAAGGNFLKAGGNISPYFARYAFVVCPADVNCDGVADFADYLEFLNIFVNGEPRADFNTDGVIDFFDYLDFADALDRC